jgi:hypothetical protein
MKSLARSAADWFKDAERAYVEQHQGCAWCGGAYRVRLASEGSKHIYNCQRCDFQVTYDTHSRRYHVVPGEELSVGSETMLEQPIDDALPK